MVRNKDHWKSWRAGGFLERERTWKRWKGMERREGGNVQNHHREADGRVRMQGQDTTLRHHSAPRLKSFKFLPQLSKHLGLDFPSQGLMSLSNGFVPNCSGFLACGIILHVHQCIPKTDRLSVFEAASCLETRKQVGGNKPSLRMNRRGRSH